MSQKCHSILRDSKGHLQAHVASVSADLEDGHLIPTHFHPEDQILFASDGVMTVTTEGGIWVVPPQRAVWIPAGTHHSVAASGRVSMRTLYLLPGLCRSLPGHCVVLNVTPLLRELILHACQCPRLHKQSPVERRILEVVLDQLRVVETVPLQLPRPRDQRAARLALELAKNPGEHRALDILCRVCGASKRTIQRVFLEETGLTFAKWRQQLRLLHGLQSLARGEKVSAAAFSAGYSSTSAFISVFRQQFGNTPARYLQTDSARGIAPRAEQKTGRR
jgi:AraC-like DNA-binding protein